VVVHAAVLGALQIVAGVAVARVGRRERPRRLVLVCAGGGRLEGCSRRGGPLLSVCELPLVVLGGPEGGERRVGDDERQDAKQDGDAADGE